ncbi:MAG TPA: ATP-binding protein [Acidimicrobiales bacterium]|nr:ATP-binding protein [Acidimicrobiales bacterium]
MGTTRRAVMGSIAALAVMGVLVAVMVPLRSHVSIATTALVLVVPVVTGVVVGGFAAGVVGVVTGFLVYDLVFIPPYYTLSVGATENWVALGVYAAVMVLVASLVARLDAARAEAGQREQGIQRLFELTDLLIEDRPLPEVLELIVSTVHDAFGLRSVALVLPVGSKLDVVASAGEPISDAELRRVAPAPGVPTSLGAAGDGSRHDRAQTVALTATGRPVGLLRIRGAALSPHEQELLRTFTNHMALTLERAQLREQALRTELLEEVDRLQRALVGAVSHDLRTPLATIKMSASTMRNPDVEVAPEQRAELLELIDSQADRLDRLVTNLLDLSRVQAGALELRNQPIAVVDLVTEARRGLGHVMDDAEVTLRIPADLPLVDVDHLLIGQVLANLLDNAVRHAPRGTAVTVSAGRHEDGLVHVVVEDKGPGIPRAERANVFLTFTRGGASGGTGVGLAIARAFVAAHGQDIWVEDAPGGGARFIFTLPVAPVAAVVP